MAETWRDQLAEKVASCIERGVSRELISVQQQLGSDLATRQKFDAAMMKFNLGEFCGAPRRSLYLSAIVEELPKEASTLYTLHFIYSSPSEVASQLEAGGSLIDFSELP
jgi:hypothetical protein